MWTRENRSLYERKGPRYSSDLTDGEWALIEGLIPPAKHGGRRREVDVRDVLNGVIYVLGPAVSGGPCPRICRPSRLCTSI